jgi:hypothetical protein
MLPIKGNPLPRAHEKLKAEKRNHAMSTATKRWYTVSAGMLTAAQADTWLPPRPLTATSPSKILIAQVIPGDSGHPATYDEAMTNRTHNATARVSARQSNVTTNLVWEGRLVNPVAPADVYVSDAGNLVTLDNWHEVGYGPVVVFYDLKGHLVRYWELKDLSAPPGRPKPAKTGQDNLIFHCGAAPASRLLANREPPRGRALRRVRTKL